MLEVSNLNAFYSNLQILWDVSLSVGDAEIVTLLGTNGAGKTTLVQSLFGFIPRIDGKVVFNGRDVTGMHPYDVVKEGLSLVPEKRELFPKMTVAENLELGGYSRSGDARDLEEIFELFPVLQERKTQLAGTLSGGEQQMLAIARALMAQPSMLILDEPSLGLSPLLVGNVLDTVARLNKDGLSILLVEQNVEHALEISNRAYILENGRIIREGDAQVLLHDDEIRTAYLGF
ncbi:MAG TPA: ABC transporter ATP-binding protein [Methanoregulaceae archaeon]|nr:ABC transporter ATP-binding protein [Methanoregulaceae archaeon]MDD5047652.1 ABC transporter ATP-binding protein [Methanoregulaceae archaeon]MDD5685214.1 ABC transporter ATP-binding protein [Methanoregulaceae archaeon]HOP67782.1 ABC transporter ATP-binding protein [Methanoregulaceae archaeon]HPJ74954.1 ABC transporter ATP-binding protein [Methanoregulaceae archaeon]